MAIVSVRRLFTGRSGDQDVKARVTTEDLWEVVVDDVTNGEQEVANAVDPNDANIYIPRIGENHVNVPNCYAVGIAPACSDESPYIWYVTVRYDSSPDFPTPNDLDGQGNATPGEHARTAAPENPLDRPATWKVGSIDREEVVRQWLPVKATGEYDYVTPDAWIQSHPYTRGTYVTSNGNVYQAVTSGTSAAGAGDGPDGTGDLGANLQSDPDDPSLIWFFIATVAAATSDPLLAINIACVNSGKCPFDPPLMTTVSIPTIIITKNVAAVSLPYIMGLKNAVNRTPWKGCEPRQAKVLKIDANNAIENQISFAQVTWEIGIDLDTWDSRVLDAGYGSIGLKTEPNPAYPGVGEPKTIQKRTFYHFKIDGENVSAPVPMDGEGNMLDPGADPVILRGVPFQQKLVDFNQMIPW